MSLTGCCGECCNQENLTGDCYYCSRILCTKCCELLNNRQPIAIRADGTLLTEETKRLTCRYCERLIYDMVLDDTMDSQTGKGESPTAVVVRKIMKRGNPFYPSTQQSTGDGRNATSVYMEWKTKGNQRVQLGLMDKDYYEYVLAELKGKLTISPNHQTPEKVRKKAKYYDLLALQASVSLPKTYWIVVALYIEKDIAQCIALGLVSLDFYEIFVKNNRYVQRIALISKTPSTLLHRRKELFDKCLPWSPDIVVSSENKRNPEDRPSGWKVFKKLAMSTLDTMPFVYDEHVDDMIFHRWGNVISGAMYNIGDFVLRVIYLQDYEMLAWMCDSYPTTFLFGFQILELLVLVEMYAQIEWLWDNRKTAVYHVLENEDSTTDFGFRELLDVNPHLARMRQEWVKYHREKGGI